MKTTLKRWAFVVTISDDGDAGDGVQGQFYLTQLEIEKIFSQLDLPAGVTLEFVFKEQSYALVEKGVVDQT